MDGRRTYYDHEPAYRRIAAAGGRGWDDRAPGGAGDSYVAVEAFLRSAHAPPPPARAIDLGCGGGQATILLARRGYDALGIDFSPSAIDLARRNAAEACLAVSFAVADCLDAAAAIEAGAFDLAIDNHALHCLVEPRHRHAFLRAAHRALRPGGTFFSETMSCEGDFAPARVEADPATRIALAGTRIFVSEAELDAELAAAGFEVLLRERRAQEPGTGALIVTVARAGGGAADRLRAT